MDLSSIMIVVFNLIEENASPSEEIQNLAICSYLEAFTFESQQTVLTLSKQKDSIAAIAFELPYCKDVI